MSFRGKPSVDADCYGELPAKFCGVALFAKPKPIMDCMDMDDMTIYGQWLDELIRVAMSFGQPPVDKSVRMELFMDHLLVEDKDRWIRLNARSNPIDAFIESKIVQN